MMRGRLSRWRVGAQRYQARRWLPGAEPGLSRWHPGAAQGCCPATGRHRPPGV